MIPTIIGITLWALIPGFIARKKGRNFWAYFFLSFLITPLISMIITICLKDKWDHWVSTAQSSEKQCPNCGAMYSYYESVCHKCRTQLIPIGHDKNK